MGSPNANEVIIIIIAVCDYAQLHAESKKNPICAEGKSVMREMANDVHIP
jgi:hypothetical protein